MSNLLSVVVRPCSCGGKLCFDQTITIDDINSELFVGGIFSFSGTPGNPKPIAYGCYEVRRLNLADSQANAVIVSEYTDCATCLVEASNALRFDICSGEKNTVYLPKTSFSPLPTVGDVFFLDVYIDNFKGGYARITSCFTFVGFVFIGPKLLNDYGLVSATPYVDCPTCLSGSPIINVVRECVSGDIYYISFPSNLYSDHLVTFTGLDGITQFCGIVKEEVVNVVITGLLVTDLGIIEKTTNDCNTCLTNVAEKKKLINCLDSEDIIIAWASQLFEAGDVTNISINNSCYLISPDPVDPEEPVTVPEFADFDPHQQCENCFECHGLTYDFSSCTEVTVCGELSYIGFDYSGGYDVIVDGDIAYLLYTNSDTLVKLDLLTNSILSTLSVSCDIGSKMALDSINGILAIPVFYTNTITWVNVNTNNIFIQTLPGFSQIPRASYFNPNDGLFYIGVWDSLGGLSFVSVYSATSYNTITLVNSFACGTDPRDIIQVGSKIYVTATVGCLGVFNSTTYANITYLCVGDTKSITYNPNLDLIYITVNASIIVINPNTLVYTQQFPAFPSCCCEKTITYNNTNNKIYVSDPCSNQIYEIDESTYSIVNIFNLTSNNQPYGMGLYNGVTYAITYNGLVSVGCTLDFLEASINSYEYVPIGDSFYHPIYDICCTVTNIRTDMDGDFTFYSLKSYSGCSDCNAVSYEVFTAIGCDIPVTGLVVAEAGQYSIGDIVRSHWGNSDFLCFEIDGTYTIGDVAEGYNFETENQPSFTSCTECTLGATVGLTLINCRTLVESYVNVSLNTWSTISGLNSLPSPSVCDAQGNCYVVVNSCPIDNVYEEFTPTNFYFDCTLCRVDNPNFQARSANTETLVCVTCCPCDGTSGSTFSVTPPHPVWTDGYGTEVTQMNMITLGGISGLNG